MPRHKSITRVLIEPLLAAVVLAAGVRAAVSIYSIPSASMLPALQVGDHILVTPYRWSTPRRGEIIVFRSPLNPAELVVKRIIAIPGDLIDSRGGRVRIGERTLAEPYVLRQAMSGAIPAQVVPGNSYFVMGDNREDSLDSRRWGALPSDHVVGRVRMVLWSSGTAGGEHPARAATAAPGHTLAVPVRLSRIFKCVE
ncbi:MAG TPA: signal peptidase I [Thermoanaerobaculia bacterium]